MASGEWRAVLQAGIGGQNRLENGCMSTKEILLEVAEKLPVDATLVDAIYELEFRQAVQDGLASLDRGEGVPLEEARKRIPQWISKYSPQKLSRSACSRTCFSVRGGRR